jgi:hypothetical protein
MIELSQVLSSPIREESHLAKHHIKTHESRVECNLIHSNQKAHFKSATTAISITQYK